MFLILLRNSVFFPVKRFLLFTWFFGIILLTKQFFWKNNFWFGQSIFKVFCQTYVQPNLHHIGYLDRWVKNISFKAWTLQCFLLLVLLWIYFNRFYSSYQGAECLRSTLAGFFLGGLHWQWPWTLLRIDPRVLGEVLHSVMFPFLFLCNILT